MGLSLSVQLAPTSGQCEAIINVNIREGHYGDTPMAGVRFSRVLWWPERSGAGVRAG
jgi:hypothetical protein